MSDTSFLGDVGNFFSGIGNDVSSLFSGGGDSSSAPAPSNADQTPQNVAPDTGSGGSSAPTAAPDTSVSTTPTNSANGGWFSNLGSNIGNWLSQPSNLLKLGLGAGGLGMGLYQSNQAQKQGAAAQSSISSIPQNLQALSNATGQQLQQISQQYQAMVNNAATAMQQMSQPLMQQFSQLINLTNQGKLSPANQQIMDAARAQLAQAAANSGGVGAEQAQTKLDDLYNRLLASQQTQALQLYQTASPAQISGIETGLAGTQQANQYTQAALQQALDTAGITDQYQLAAIQEGLRNDQQARSSMNNFYSALAQVLAGTPTKTATT